MQVVNPYASALPPTPRRAAAPPAGEGQSAAEPRDAITLALQDTAAEEPVRPTGLLEHAATALLVASGLAGLAGSFAPTITALSQPAVSVSAAAGQADASRPASTQVAAPSEQASRDTHIIANVDATEPIVEPFVTGNLGQFQKITRGTDGHVTVDMQVERNASPLVKAASGLGVIAATAAPLIAFRRLVRKDHGTAVAVGLTLAGVLGTVMVGSTLGVMHNGVGGVISAAADMKHAEGVWSGRQALHLADGERQVLDKADSKAVEPAQIGRFLGEHMKKYPDGNVVVTLTGHGLYYRHLAGVQGDAFEGMLQTATREAGRPIDVIVLESCLSGNLEALNAMYPSARYAVVSEESIAAGAVGRMFEASTKALDGQAVTPRELATRIVSAAKGDKGVETLAVIDLSKMPQLNEALDRLGGTLLGQVNGGNVDAIRGAVKSTMVFPLHEGSIARQFAVGDLRQFAQNLQSAYAGDTSAAAAAVRGSADGVLDALDEAVVTATMTEAYKAQGAISVQLPGKDIAKYEKESGILGARGLSTYAHAESPAQWRAFVSAMSAKMK